MSRTYLCHPKHGKKVAYLEAEAAMDEKAGWVRFDPALPVTGELTGEPDESEDPGPDIIGEAELLRATTPAGAPVSSPVTGEVVTKAPPKAAPKRRGRPPKSKPTEAG